MPGLEGTIKTPAGPVQKKTALIVGGGVAAIGGIMWYRQKKAASTTSTAAPTDGEIDPATGFVYGTPEDAAALAAQGSYVSPADTTATGSSTIPVSNVGFTSNSAWVQGVIQYMIGNDLVSDSSALSAALGKYITGAYVTDSEVSLIEQAIAVEGFPPVAGSSGYPPSLNRTPSTSTTTSGVPHITNLRIVGSTATTMSFAWGHDSVIPDSQLPHINGGVKNYITGTATTYTATGLKSKEHVKFAIQGLKGSTLGPSVSVEGTTK